MLVVDDYERSGIDLYVSGTNIKLPKWELPVIMPRTQELDFDHAHKVVRSLTNMIKVQDSWSLDTSLELAIEYGQTLITNLEAMLSWSFVELGKRILQISAALGRINDIRLLMAGAERLKQLSPPRLDKIRRILRFGIEVAKMMLDKLPSANQNPKRCDVFISFAGEIRKEREFDYVARLKNQLEKTAGSGRTLNIFVEEPENRQGQTSDPIATMLTHVLTARIVVCVISTHYVKKKWPLVELLCSLARNEKLDPVRDVSPLVVDAMPGCHWVLLQTKISK